MNKNKDIILIIIVIISAAAGGLLFFIKGLCPNPIDLDPNSIVSIEIKDVKNGGGKIAVEKEDWPEFLKKMRRIKYKLGEYHENFEEDFEVIIEYNNGSIMSAAFYSDRKPQAIIGEYRQAKYELYFYDANMLDYLFKDRN